VNSIIHKDSIEIVKNLRYKVKIVNCSIKGLVDIDGDLALSNCIL